MAELSKVLPTEIDSQKRFIAAAPATPSPLTAIADFGTGILGVADRAINSLAQGNASKRAAADEAAKNDAVKRITGGIFSDPSAAPQANIPPGSEQAYANVKPMAQQAANVQTAGQQGKIDPATAQVRSLAVFRQALASNPGHEYAVWQAFKEMGVDNMMMQQYKNAEAGIESEESAQRDTEHKVDDYIVNKMGDVNFYKKSPQEQAEARAQAGVLIAKEADLDAQIKYATLAKSRADLTADQQKLITTQTSKTVLGSAVNFMTSNFSNVSKMSINLLADPTLQSQPGRLEQLQSHLLNVAIPAMDLQYQTKRSELLGTMTPEDLKQLDDTYNSQKASLISMISGPQSVVEMNKRVLQALSDSFGIEYAKAAPTLMKVQKLIGPQALGVILSPGLMKNTGLMQRLGDELNGVIADPSKIASFSDHIQALAGNVDMSSWDPAKQRDAAPGMINAMNNLAHDSASSNGTDKQGHLALVNSVKATAGNAVDVVPQWGFKNVLMQGKALNTRGVTTALFNTTANNDDRAEAVRAWIPAVTKTYMTLSSMKSGDNYYDVKLDPHTLQWKAVWNGKAETRAMPGVGTEMSINAHPAPTTAVLEQASTLNHMLNNLSDAAAKGHDNSFGKAIPYNEARRFFATGEIPNSLQKPTTKNGKTPEQNVDDAIAHLLDFTNNLKAPELTTTSSQGVKVNTASENFKKYSPIVEQAAAEFGVPKDLAFNLVQHESGFNPEAVSAKGAKGLGQVMDKTGAGYGVADLNSLDPLSQARLSMRILSDNFKRTGNWHDALAMYHSGVDLATAVRQGRNDGNQSTLAYVGAVSPSSISPENLARYGYVRR